MILIKRHTANLYRSVPALSRARLDGHTTGRAARATGAAGLAWGVCCAVLGEQRPYPAALAALLIAESTVFRSFVAGAQYAAGCAVGMLIGLPATVLIGPAWLGLCVVVFLSVVAAGNDRLGHHGVHVPITALFAFVLGRDHLGDEVVPHVLEMGVGVAVGIAFNALLFPPLRLRPAERALDILRTRLAATLEGLATAVQDGRSSQAVLGPGWSTALDDAVARAHAALAEAHESKRWNVRPAARRALWHLDRTVLATLEDVADRVRAIGRLLDEAPPPPPAGNAEPGDATRDPALAHCARLLRSTALCVYGCRGGRPHPVLPAAQRACRRLEDLVTTEGGNPAPAGLDCRLVEHLKEALACLGDVQDTDQNTPESPMGEDDHARTGTHRHR
ncbi:aromatic acid exporter family protein [Streptomyces flavidovirens]|uniref:FUSC family protein n=1 Tax=Streptomyces flavidovirens TaxID=67298 RepID=UPI00343B7EC4